MRKLAALILCLSLSGPSWGAIALVGSGQGYSTTTNGFTTGTMDTSGSNFIVVVYAGNSGTFTITDSKSNTWTPLTQSTVYFGLMATQIFYAYNATVGTGHTFTVDGTTNNPALMVAWFSGVLSTDPLDSGSLKNGSTHSGTTVQATTFTPSETGTLVISAFKKESSTASSVDGGFTIAQDITNGDFGHLHGSLGYLIQTSAAAENPTWTYGPGGALAISNAVFKSAGGGGGGGAVNCPSPFCGILQ